MCKQSAYDVAPTTPSSRYFLANLADSKSDFTNIVKSFGRKLIVSFTWMGAPYNSSLVTFEYSISNSEFFILSNSSLNANILISWNFKHIVNVVRIIGYNSVNLAEGYKQIDIRSPRELIIHED